MIDIQILRLARTRVDYNRVKHALDLATLETKTRTLFRAVGKYYDAHPSHGQVDFTVFIPFIKRSTLSSMEEDDAEVYLTIVKNMAKSYPDSDTRQAIIRSVQDHNLAHRAMTFVEEYNDGGDIDIADALKDVINRYDIAIGQEDLPEVDGCIDDMLDQEDGQGLLWRLPCLNRVTRPLRYGDFGIIAARPDQGKTSFIASELTYLAAQLGDGECALWLNNEGVGSNIVPRCMQAALDTDFDGLVKLKEAGTLYSDYDKVMNGSKRIRIMNIHGYSNGQVEQILANVQPKIVVYDMIDNVQGFRSEARVDLMLERMYQWAREMCVKYECIGIATSQISSEGAGEQYPNMKLLKDSQTGKQGACDFQLMIGSKEGCPDNVNTRWLSMPKNKLRKIGSRPLKEQVTFNRDTSRYTDVPYDAR